MANTMIKILLPAAVVLVGLLGPIPLQAQRVPGTGLLTNREIGEARYRRDVLLEIQPTLDAWLESWSTHDADQFADLYAENAQLFFGSDPVFGRDGIRQYFEEISGSVTGVALSLSDFYVSDRLAFAMGVYSYQVMTEGRPGERVQNIFIATFVGHGSRWHIRTQVFRDALPLELGDLLGS